MAKKGVLINDLSGLGKCSLTASIPVLSVMGVQPCPIPTAVLTNQTGYPTFYCNDCTDELDRYITEWKSLGFKPDGIYSGFLSSEKQVDKIINFIDSFSDENTLIMVDPVMGDNGKRYSMFTDTLAQKMKLLVSKADIITPNLTECCILCDRDFYELSRQSADENYLDKISSLGKELTEKFGVKTAVITGILHKGKACKDYGIYNLVISDRQSFFTRSPLIGESYSGTGDLFSSVLFAGVLRGDDFETTVKKAVSFIEKSLLDTICNNTDRNDGIEFEKNLSMLID